MTDTVETAPPAHLDRTEWKMLINGQWVDSASGETFETFNPATNAVLTSVP